MSLSWRYRKPALTPQARHYGEIGVAAAIVTALMALGVLLVVGAVLGPCLARRPLAVRGPFPRHRTWWRPPVQRVRVKPIPE
jgi:hypothetical protein